jgi:DNA-3-methyladenine glycosylase
MGKRPKKFQKFGRDFYQRDTKVVAKELLGKYLVFEPPHKHFVGKIVEVEAYLGENDLASHASKSRTKRNEVMFGPAGHTYVYFTYGLFWLLNVVTEKEGVAGAVLLRALEPVEGIEDMVRNRGGRNGHFLTSGPAKITEAFGIDGKINRADLCGDLIWIQDCEEVVKPSQIVAARRIGINYAGKWKDKKLRFYIRGSEFVSKL